MRSGNARSDKRRSIKSQWWVEMEDKLVENILNFSFAVVANMSEAAEAALAAAELDGNRPRKVNPLTIIQVSFSYSNNE